MRRRKIPKYGTVEVHGTKYYRTYVEDSEGKRVAVYGKTREELYDKEIEVQKQLSSDSYRKTSPTVKEYCEKWLEMQSVHIRATTLTDYTSKVRRHIVAELGHMRMSDKAQALGGNLDGT